MSVRSERKVLNLNDLFGVTPENGIEQQEADVLGIQEIAIDKLVPAKHHPFKPYIEEKLEQLVESIKENGVMQPIIVRASGNNYEILAGHNRVNAAKRAGLASISAVIKDVDDEEAAFIVTETNLKQREKLFPSEKAFAYKMQLEAKKSKLKNSRVTSDIKGFESSSQIATGMYARDIANDNNITKDEVHRYLRLTFLIRDLLDLVDKERIPFVAGVDLSFLSEDEQLLVLDQMNIHNVKIDLKKSKALKNMVGRLNEERVYKILMGEDKKGNHKSISLRPKFLSRFFSPEQSKKEIEQIIEDLLTRYYKNT